MSMTADRGQAPVKQNLSNSRTRDVVFGCLIVFRVNPVDVEKKRTQISDVQQMSGEKEVEILIEHFDSFRMPDGYDVGACE